jgi:membrane protease YdiL (CAAX protease family)
VLFVERRPPAALGLRRERWPTSLGVSAVFAAGATINMLEVVDLGRYPIDHLLGAIVQLNVGGLFETFLYTGLVHLRLRDAFGPIPALVLTAGIYSLWHIGTELPLHDDPVAALGMLFVVGLLCQAVFACTYNLLAVWPLFFTAGVMHDFLVNLDLRDEIGTSLWWPALGWMLAIGVPLVLWRLRPRAG